LGERYEGRHRDIGECDSWTDAGTVKFVALCRNYDQYDAMPNLFYLNAFWCERALLSYHSVFAQ